MECTPAEMFFDVVGMIEAEKKTPRDYDDGGFLYHAELNLLDAVYAHPGANAKELSEYLGVTQGAVTQLTGKLVKKKLVERYTTAANRKEKYYRLTPEGESARCGHQTYHGEANERLCRYFRSLNESETKLIFDFLTEIKECMPISAFSCRLNEQGEDCARNERRYCCEPDIT
jgi:DNA-binding MarR family transcriptional regulator